MQRKPDLDGPRIIIHNLTTRAVENFPALFNFDQRGLIYARSGDTVITRRPPDPGFIDYLSALGWEFSDVKLFHPPAETGCSYNYTFHEPEVLETARKAPGYIDTYHLTREERAFASATGKPLYGQPEIAQRYGIKSGFASLCTRIGIPVPRGYSGMREPEHVVRCLDSLFREGAAVCVIKEDEGTSSFGSTVVDRESFQKMSPGRRLEMAHTALHKIDQINDSSSARVEVWIDGVVSSPSVQTQVLPDGGIIINSTHDQFLHGREKAYHGASFPCRSTGEEGLKVLLDEALVITRALAEQGYTGFLGLDAVWTGRGEIYWVDANLRKPGTFYPRLVAERLMGGLDGVFYHVRNFNLGRGKGYAFRDIYSALDGCRFDPARRQGAVVSNVGALAEEGRVDVVSLAEDRETADGIQARVEGALRPLMTPDAALLS